MKADLHDAELDELDTLLGAAPDPLQPLDVVSMDGYLCAVAVQPRIVPTEEWLPRLLDSEGTRWPPASMDSTWFERVQALAVRRFEAIVRGLSEEGGFDPVVSQWSPDEEPHPDGNSHPDGEPHPEGDPYAEVAPASREIVHWASGFLYGCEAFEALLDHPDDAVHVALSHILRHVPPANDDDRRLIAELDAQHPLKDSPQAIDETVQAALTLWDLTVRDRMAVRTVRREGAKVGRNDPCPCGSGRKFKQCHGRS